MNSEINHKKEDNMTYAELIENLSKCLKSLDKSNVLLSEINEKQLLDLYDINFKIYCKILGFEVNNYSIK